MTVDLNRDLKDLEGKNIPNANMGKLVANSLAGASKGDSLKLWDWAIKLNAGEVLNLDPSDARTFEDFITNNESFTILAKAQILSAIKELPKGPLKREPADTKAK